MILVGNVSNGKNKYKYHQSSINCPNQLFIYILHIYTYAHAYIYTQMHTHVYIYIHMHMHMLFHDMYVYNNIVNFELHYF